MTTVFLEKDENGDLILPLSNELCEQLGWKIGDTIVWTKGENDSYILSKKDLKEVEK